MRKEYTDFNSFRHRACRTLFLLFFVASSFNLHAFDLVTRNGVEYKDARFRKHSNGSIEIMHKYGVVNIPLSELPADYIKKLITENKLRVNLKLKPRHRNGIWGYTDSKGRPYIEPQFENAGYFKKGLAPVQVNGKWGFIDQAGNLIIPCQYEDVEYFSSSSDWAMAKLNGKWGFIDSKGKVVIPFLFDETAKFSEDKAKVKQDGKWGFIDTRGSFIIKPKYDNAADFSSGLAPVKTGNNWGYINEKGEFIIEPQFDYAHPFIADITSVQLNGKWGFIDKKGKIVIKPEFDAAFPFLDNSDTTIAILGKNLQLIDRTGKVRDIVSEKKVKGFFEKANIDKALSEGIDKFAKDLEYPEEVREKVKK
jgi:hypothetical protein